jgi:protein-disulfide isomerase
MSRPLFASCTAFLLCVFAGPAQNARKSALDKATFEAYVRHLYVMDSRINVQVSDPKPSAELPGFLDVAVHAWAGERSQDFLFYVSKDGSKIVQGSVFDISQNPFKKDLEKLKTDSAPSYGTPGAPVVIVGFSDFECPYCKEDAAMLRANLTASYPKQVRFYFKDFPLESIHPWAKPAAMAGRCVFRQNPAAFWNYYDWIYLHQADITPQNLKQKVMDWAATQKDTVNAIELGQCIDTKATEAEVNRTIEQGKALEINATPTLFINGRRIAQAIDWPSLKTIIDYEIQYQKTARNAGEDCCSTELKLPGQQTQAYTPPQAPKSAQKK